MKTLSTLLFAVILIAISCQNSKQQPDASEKFQKRMTDKLYPFEGYYLQKNYPIEEFGLSAYKTGLKQAKSSLSESRAGAWTQQGPGNIGGRVNTIAINPDNPTEMMLGYSLGGIHKTVDFGTTWYPVFDDQITLSLSDITYDPNNTDIVYAGSGDLNITGYPVTGNGIYKSTDGGESWNQSGLTEAGIISEVAVSHQNSDIIYAASMGVPFETNSDRGFYKSTDGGQTWRQTLFINGNTGIIDMEVSKQDDNIIYAASWTRFSSYTSNTISSGITRILKSVDGGETWNYLTKDLPTGDLVRPGLAMYEGDHDIVYALFSRFFADDDELDCSDGYYIEGIYKTTDGGDNWDALELDADKGWNCGVVGGFSWYFGKIRVNPQDPDDIIVLGVDLIRSRDGGENWYLAAPRWWTYEVHADKHDLVFDGSLMVLATDGGAYRSSVDIEQWLDIENIISTQFYRVGYNPHEPTQYYGGAQDNGTTSGNEQLKNNWARVFGGDGFGTAFHPTDPNTYYVETQRGRLYQFDSEFFNFTRITDSISSEGSVNWDMPYFLGTDDPDVVYCARDRVWRTISEDHQLWEPISPVLTDDGSSTVAISHNISAVAQSSVDANFFFAGTSDGYLWRSTNHGDNWERVGLNMPERYFSDVRPSPNDASRVYASITGYEDNDNTPYIYMSQDSGLTYVQIAGDMPQVAVNDIFIPTDQADEQTVIIATDAGVYVTNNLGENWFRLGNNMPIMPIYDLAHHVDRDQLIAGSHARGIYTIPMEELQFVNTTSPDVLKDVEVYPTPAVDYITVQGKAKNYDYSVTSISGQSTLSGNIDSGQQIDISDLAKGLYVVTLNADGKTVSKKVLKQ